jgi:hypothetical protein
VFATHPLVAFNFDPVVSNLFTVRPDGSGLRQLTHSTTSNHRATQAHFTPDGHIIYTRVTPRRPDTVADQCRWQQWHPDTSQR